MVYDSLNCLAYSRIEVFNQLCAEYSWFVTLISIIISGLVSLAISKYYYDKSNRISAITSIVSPVCKLINKPQSRDGVIEFRVLKDLFCINFLSKNEQKCIRALYDSYEALVDYNADIVVSNAIVQWYHKVLTNNGVDINIYPVEDCEGNIKAYTIPPAAECELFSLVYNNLKKWDDYEVDLNTVRKINNMLIKITKEVFSIEMDIVDFFAGTSLVDVVKCYEDKHWGEKFNKFDLCKKEFINNFPDLFNQ